MKLLFDGWGTLPIAKYQEIARLTDNASKELEKLDKEDVDYSAKRGDILLSLDLDVVAALYGTTREALEGMPYPEVAEMCAATQWVNKMPEVEVPDIIEIGGTRYTIVTDMSAFTFGQYLDWQTLQADAFNNTAQLMACLLIPEGKTYAKGYNIADTIKDIQYLMPFALAQAVFRFFANAQRASAKSVLRSMMIQKMKKAITAKRYERQSLMREIRALRRIILHGLN